MLVRRRRFCIANCTAAIAVALIAFGCRSTPRPVNVRCEVAVAYEGRALVPPVAPYVEGGDVEELPIDDARAAALDAALDEVAARQGAAHLTAAIVTDDAHTWTGTRSRLSPAPPRAWWASVGKAFTALVVMQLVEEGRVALEQPLADFAPDFPNARAITLRHLLAHTSGSYSFQLDPEFRARTGHIPPEELVEIASAHEPRFCPGHDWDYSNTGYVLLGLVIEAVERAPYHEVVNRRLFAPAALDAIAALSPGATPSDVALPAPPETDTEGVHHDLTTPFAAGVVASSSLEMARAWRRVLGARMVSRASLNAMFENLHPMFGSEVEAYGLGVMVYRLGEADPAESDVWLGHSGGTSGARAVVAWSTGRHAFVAVALTGEGSPEAVALHLLRVLRASE